MSITTDTSVCISGYAEVISGFAFKSEWFQGFGTKVIRIGDLQDGAIRLDTCVSIDADEHRIPDQFRTKEGDILMALSGATTGKTAVVSRQAANCFVNQRVALIRARDADTQRLMRFAFEGFALKTLLNRAGGVAQPNLSPNEIKTLEIPLPPLSEQKRIADILDKVDAIRRKRHETVAYYDELLKSTFIQMFGNPIRNPMAWDIEPLGRVATLDRGKSRHRPRDAKFLYGGPYPLVQTGDITNSNGFVRSYSQTHSEEGLAQSRLWPAGTLCITIAANIGKTAVLTFDACFPDSIVGLIAGKKLTIEYVRHWFVAMEKETDAAATQVAQKNINLDYLRNLNIQIPPIDKQQEFSKAVNKIRQARGNAEVAQNEASALFNSLVQRAFKGEL